MRILRTKFNKYNNLLCIILKIEPRGVKNEMFNMTDFSKTKRTYLETIKCLKICSKDT